MPGGMITVDSRNTFASAIFLAATRKTVFGSDVPDVTKAGEPKWAADVAVTYLTEPGRKPVSEVISVSLTGADPGASVSPGTPVEFDGLKCGVSAASRNDRGGVSGGRLFFMAAAIRPGVPANGRQHKQETAA